jgi:DHA2 family methylenomycin A resistance protein-like MFS transporter
MTTQALPVARERSYGLLAVCFGFFLVLLDTSALNVAIAAIQHDFGGTLNELQWIVNAYTIVFASLVLTSGALGDRYGAKRLYQIGLALFTSMSLCCALAPTVGVLVATRMLQGLGAAVMLPASLALLSHAFPNAIDRARAVSFWAAIVSLGFAAGPALGGALTSAFGWRSIFLINVPIGIVAMAMVAGFTEETSTSNAQRIDWMGQTAISLALWALTFALIDAGRTGWRSTPVLGAFAAFMLLVIGFMVLERRSDAPVLPRVLFSRPAFSVCVTASLLLGFGMYGTLFIESIYLQDVRHLSPLVAGITILPFSVGPAVATRLIDRFQPDLHFKPRLIVGYVVALAGAAIMALSALIPNAGLVVVGLALLGGSMGYITPAMTTGVLTTSPSVMSGVASGILNAARQVGASIGVALMGTFVQIHHAGGMVLSFALIIVLYAALAVVARQAIR